VSISSALAELREMNGQKFLRAEDSPVKVILWRLLVQPLPPKKSHSLGDGVSLELPDEVQQAEQVITTVGKIVDAGAVAFLSKTNAGLCLADEPNKPLVGQFVLFSQYAGQEVTLNDEQKTKLRIIDDTEVLAVIKDPEAIKRYT
jgi:co-chaperonin GroES (HSP10)